MKNLKSFSQKELEQELVEAGFERYRSNQIFSWVWQHGLADLSLMTNISKKMQQRLTEEYYVGQFKIITKNCSLDGTVKFLFELEDGEMIESVFIPETDRNTVCVSTQVGCPLGCVFCASGKKGFKRNLFAWEMTEQILKARSHLKAAITNIVFMGVGEPLLNLTQVLNAIQLINSANGFNIGARHITVSTAGVIEGIRTLAEHPAKIKLAISLNATTDAVRNELMPINRRNPIKELIESARIFARRKQVRVSFEYIMIDGVNDKKADGQRLVKLLKGVPCKINIIPLNEMEGLNLRQSPASRIFDFVDVLKPHPMTITMRKSRGADIMAGCGQLRSVYG